MIKIDKYKEFNYGFPSQTNTDPKLKSQSEYCLQYCEAIYSTHIRNKAAIPYDWMSYAQELRDYAAGRQDEFKYTESIKFESDAIGSGSRSSANGARKGYGNINTKIISVAPNLMNVIHGIIENYEEDLFVNTIDPISGEVELNNKWKAYVDAKYSKLRMHFMENAGVGLSEDVLFPDDISLTELDQYKALGGFKADWAIAMEEVLKFTDKASGWDRTIKRKFIDDIITLNIIAARSYYCAEEKIWKWSYIDPDPSRFVIQYSEEQDFSDSEFGGYYTHERISHLVQMGIPLIELEAVAREYCGRFGNADKDKWDSVNTRSTDGTYPWFNYKVPVLHTSWIDTDVQHDLKFKKPNGSYNLIGMDWGEKPRDLKKKKIDEGYNQEIISTNKRYVYQASYIVGTKIVYDYGKMLNQPKNSAGKPMLPFAVYKGSGSTASSFNSMIENILPFLDQIQLAHLRTQDIMAKAMNDGVSLNLRLLSGLNMGGKKISEDKAFEMFKKTSVLPYLDVSSPGQSYKGGDVTPLHKIQGGVGTRLGEEIQILQHQLSMIERVTGVSASALGSSPTSGESATATKYAMQGTRAVLQPFINGIFDVKRKLGEYTTMVIPIIFRAIPECAKHYEKIIGEQDVKFLAQQVNQNGIEFGLYTEARPDYEDKQDLLNTITEAMMPRKDGVSSIDFAHGMKLKQYIMNGGNIKQTGMIAEFMIRKEEKKKAEAQQRNIEMQGQQNLMLKQEEAKTKIADTQLKVQAEMAILNQNHVNSKDLELYKYNLESLRGSKEELNESEKIEEYANNK